MACTKECLSKKIGNHRNHCSTCHEFFNSDGAFDMHRTGKFNDPKDPRRCRTEQEMTEKGMVMNKAGYWTTGRFDRWER